MGIGQILRGQVIQQSQVRENGENRVGMSAGLAVVGGTNELSKRANTLKGGDVDRYIKFT